MTQELQTIDREATSPTQPAAAYLARLHTPVSQIGMRSALNNVASVLGRFALDECGQVIHNRDGSPRGDWKKVDWRTLNAANVDAIMARVQGAPASRNKILAALKGVAEAAYKQDVITADTYQKIKLCKGVRGSREQAGRAIEPWEYEAVIKACCHDTTPAGARDAAMIAIAYYTGCRRAELAGMRYQDMRQANPEHTEIQIIGKGDKERTLDIDNGALHALRDWLSLRGADPGPMFYAIDKAGHILAGHGLGTTSLHEMLGKRVKEAALPNALRWHDLRRTVASELIDAGVDYGTVGKILGHAQINTTARYDRRKDDARRAGIRKRSVAYYGRGAKLV